MFFSPLVAVAGPRTISIVAHSRSLPYRYAPFYMFRSGQGRVFTMFMFVIAYNPRASFNSDLTHVESSGMASGLVTLLNPSHHEHG